MKTSLLTTLLVFGCAPAFGVELLRAPLPPLPPSQEVRMDELTLPPGSSAPAHRHDAHVYVYVIEGTVEMQVAGKPLQRLTAGQTFTETPDDVHTVMRNPSDTEPARFVSFIIKNADAPVSVPAPAATN
jgi:quercetin dioxygenase-like cupin family protein